MVYLVADSVCGVSKKFAKENNIKIIQLRTNLDDVVREEGFEEDWDEFFEAVKISKDFPKTSCPSPEEFNVIYNEIFKKDKSAEIITVTLAESLSGTYNAACLSVKQHEKSNRLFVIDSGSIGQGSFVLIESMLEMIKEGKKAAEIVKESEELKKKILIQFVPQTMEYLRRGGRIGLLSATIASVLQIKPILHFKNGALFCAKKALGMGKSLGEMIAAVPRNVKKLYVIYIHESGELVAKLMSKVNQTFNLNIKEAIKIGPVVGTHIGIGAVGLVSLEA